MEGVSLADTSMVPSDIPHTGYDSWTGQMDYGGVTSCQWCGPIWPFHRQQHRSDEVQQLG